MSALHLTTWHVAGFAAYVLLCLAPLRGRLLCAVWWHRWGRWHSYRMSDLERTGKPRVYRCCERWGCSATQDGTVCE